MLTGNLFKVREGKFELWKKWCEELNGPRRIEAIETLVEEQVSREVFLSFQIGDVPYVIGLGDGECLPAAEREINKKHKEYSRECLEKIGKVDCLYDLSVNK